MLDMISMVTSVKKPKIVLIIGSGPDARDAADFPREGLGPVVAINNAWQVRDDWNYLIHPEDFPQGRMPLEINEERQKIITAHDYVQIQNEYGGFVYAGGTMAFTAGYWALGALKPDVLAYFGCDMTYEKSEGQTHFYGEGTPDPLREDVTLQSLEAKSSRLMLMAASQNCMTVNLSQRPRSRLIFPRMNLSELSNLELSDVKSWSLFQNNSQVQTKVHNVLKREAELGYFVPSGRYWQEAERLDAGALRLVDDLWLKAAA